VISTTSSIFTERMLSPDRTVCLSVCLSVCRL